MSECDSSNHPVSLVVVVIVVVVVVVVVVVGIMLASRSLFRFCMDVRWVDSQTAAQILMKFGSHMHLSKVTQVCSNQGCMTYFH